MPGVQTQISIGWKYRSFSRSRYNGVRVHKVLSKRFLKLDTIGFIPTGGYSSNVNYSQKALMWLVYREQLDECRIMHVRIGREYNLPALPRLSVDGFCEETNNVYEFCCWYWHGHTCLPFRDVTRGAGDTLAERYEKTMSRSVQITQAVYQVEIQGECDFDKGILADHSELKTSYCTARSAEPSQCSVRG